MTPILNDIQRDRFEAVWVCGTPALFTTERIPRCMVPKGLYAYDMQADETDWSRPCLLARHITVEHFGTVLAAAPISLPETGYRDLDKSDFVWPSPSDRPTIAEFARQYDLKLSYGSKRQSARDTGYIFR